MKLTTYDIDFERMHYQRLRGTALQEFQNRVVSSWLYHEHALEGVVLTQTDLDRALRGCPTRSWCESSRNQCLLRMRTNLFALLECSTDPVVPTLEELRKLHTSLCETGDTTAGRYRKRDTSPGVYNLEVAPANSISYHLRKTLEQAEVDLRLQHPIRAIANFHWDYMRAFPFDGKSGLVGRLMMNAMLASRGYPPAIIHAQSRHQYFGALQGNRQELERVIVEAIAATIEAARSFQAVDGPREEQRPSPGIRSARLRPQLAQ